MFSTRKFYDTATAEAEIGMGGGTDIASIMAKSGRLATPGNEGEIPKINTEKKEETQTASANGTATANQAQPADKGKPESSTPAKETPATTTQTETAPKGPSWQEVLKQQQPNDVLKELGYDDQTAAFIAENKQLDPKLLGLLQHWKKSDGDVGPYLKALSTDYGKMAPEDVMRHQLQLANPELDGKQLETLYKVKVIQRYKLDPVNFSEEEVEEGRVELMADVKSIRQALTADQQNYLLPKPQAKTEGPSPQELQRQQETEAYKQAVENDPYTKNLLSSNKLTIGEGEDQFDFPVDGKALSEIMYSPDKWANKLLKSDGSPDAEKMWIINGVAEYGSGFFKQLAQHYKTLGGKSAIAPIENAKPPAGGTAAKAEVESSDPAAAMAKKGRMVRGGE